MKGHCRRNRAGALFAGVAGLATAVHAQSTSFTYQGQVRELGGAAPAVLDLRFALFDSALGGLQLGGTQCADNVVLDSDGRFVVTLDFGSQFSGLTRHLEISLRSDTTLSCSDATGFTLLTPRQAVAQTPQATYANTAGNANTANNANLLGGFSPANYRDAASLTGTLPAARLPVEAARRDQANSFTNPSNSYFGNGGGLTNLSASALTGTLPAGLIPAFVARRDTENVFTAAQNTFTSSFVGINRTTQESPAERFGIGNIGSDGGYVGMYIRSNQTSGLPFYGYKTPGTSAWTRLTDAGEYELFINGIERFSVGSGGQTSIALTDANVVSALSITGTAQQTTELSIRNNANNPWVFGADGPGGASGNGKFTIRNSTGGPALTTFDTNGNVGINDITPQSKLTIGGTDQWAPGIGSGFGDFSISNAAGTNALSMGVSTSGSGAGTARLWTRGTASMVLGTGSGSGADLLWLNGNGTVGIGTSAGLTPLSFASTLGNKIALWGANSVNHYGMGVTNSAMRIYTPGSTDVIAFGDGNATTMNEWVRFSNGRIGVRDNALAKSVNVRGGLALDTFGESDGVNSLANGLTFGFGSGEGITSRRTPGAGQFGLQFYAGGVERMTVLNTGNIGVGTTSPGDRLAVRNGALSFHSPTNDVPYVGFDFDAVTDSLRVRANVSSASLNTTWMTINRTNGNVGIGVSSPAAKLDVGGLARVHAIDITGGADLSEGFSISPAQSTEPVPGHVVVMDSARPGQLMVASEPYDSRVVGVISGANGVKTGMMMRQEGSIADGSQPVALTGRVYVMVDASESPVAVGDLLTTSATPGHAMKATDPTRAYGAVIGKAMEPMPHGRGMVLVLINLH